MMHVKFLILPKELLLLWEWVKIGCFLWRLKMFILALWQKWKTHHGCVIFDMVTWNLVAWRSFKGWSWWRGFLKLLFLPQVCEECVVGKQHRSQFPKCKSWRAKEVLGLIHSDICWPITPISNGGKKYFITFIDDYSRKTWVYILKEKSEAFNHILL